MDEIFGDLRGTNIVNMVFLNRAEHSIDYSLFPDIIDRSHDLIRRMALKLLSAVADPSGTEL